MYQFRPLANGIRTDHPVPGLPFVDDSHIPLDQGGDAIEAVGRNKGEGMWGRVDDTDGGWLAFTTDPIRHDLGWSVRHHPQRGRTVLLMRNEDIAPMHGEWYGPPLLFRAGGYWWDGVAWYRPDQVWDPVRERYEHRKASAAVTVSAADMLDAGADPGRAHLTKITAFNADTPAPDNWRDHLALWAQLHNQQQKALPLDECVVNIASPELAGDQLLGIPEVAALGEITASTLRAYLSRGEGDMPMPQATVGGRAMWSQPVAQDWADARRRSADGIKTAMSAGDRHRLSPGAADIRDRFATDFHRSLWGRPDWRKRWVLRHRNEADVQEIADDLAWSVAISLKQILPVDLLSATVRHAVLDEYASSLAYHDERKEGQEVKPWELTLGLPVTGMLDWFIRHHPASAKTTIGDILRTAEDRWDVPPTTTGKALHRALSMDSKLDEATLEEYLALVLPSDQAS
ncbi:hypothetical protein [Streptomyces sp. NPDC046909]|uniref:hypothetical protein n=1 Tax=Streptomyces sp. NPDC046909 TaxID=3155617 RepID=UPI00340591BE